MQTPDPLPQSGAWLVMADGSLYEVRHCDGEYGPCTVAPADAEGVFYWSVDEGERIWTPWADVEAVGTYDEVDAIAARIGAEAVARLTDRLADWTPPAPVPETGPRIVGQLGAYAIGAPAPRIAHTTRWDVTIWHAPGAVVPDYLRGAVQNVIQAALRAAGIDDAAVIVGDETP